MWREAAGHALTGIESITYARHHASCNARVEAFRAKPARGSAWCRGPYSGMVLESGEIMSMQQGRLLCCPVSPSNQHGAGGAVCSNSGSRATIQMLERGGVEVAVNNNMFPSCDSHML